MNLEDLNEETLKAIKRLIKGFCLKEVVNEYVLDEQGNKHLSKQKVSKKLVPPNTDIVKMLYTKTTDNNMDFASWSDEELEKEKQKLIKLLKKGEINVSGNNESENKV